MMTLIPQRRVPFRKSGVPVPKPHGLRVIVVVPQEAFAETLAASLREGGHEVRIEADTAAALADTRIPQSDVVILSVDGPDEGGFAVARHIQEQAAWRKPLLVALTAKGSDESYSRSRELGVHLYLERPIDLDRLRGTLVRFHHLLADVEGFDPMI